ncbi:MULTISPECIES: TetR family transcriptional regulator [unclassified Curtobacterium]|nr:MULTISPECIES: TetR family transcriptional regulator [unclassified Curtobacterium]PYY65719.1 TetR/AcrR family transcriptional regulator [Curtobacterium sp. MCPF17_003]PZE73101.1 TetR/AcrR family transcriptional regulator [Curtobacterium sp. MCPF17_018]WIB71190.1 TetR family transcriptional regulator [Curtobacterium sp. MCBD17_026]
MDDKGTRPRADRSAKVKDAIRAAATAMFAEEGYHATGVRDIARTAGVDPAIVIRHFGSKEGLFLETMSLPPVWREVFDGPVDQVGHAITRLIMSGREGGLGPYAALIRASDRPEVAEKLRRALIEDFVIPLAARLDGEDAELRAHLFTAQVQGLMDVLAVRPDQFLLDTPADVIVRWYGAALQRTLTGAP